MIDLIQISIFQVLTMGKSKLTLSLHSSIALMPKHWPENRSCSFSKHAGEVLLCHYFTLKKLPELECENPSKECNLVCLVELQRPLVFAENPHFQLFIVHSLIWTEMLELPFHLWLKLEYLTKLLVGCVLPAFVVLGGIPYPTGYPTPWIS